MRNKNTSKWSSQCLFRSTASEGKACGLIQGSKSPWARFLSSLANWMVGQRRKGPSWPPSTSAYTGSVRRPDRFVFLSHFNGEEYFFVGLHRPWRGVENYFYIFIGLLLATEFSALPKLWGVPLVVDYDIRRLYGWASPTTDVQVHLP
jgi:hypothetical protein